MRFTPLFISMVLLIACGQPSQPTQNSESKQLQATQARPVSDQAPSIEFEKFELANGLDVIFHVDRSDPVVAVTLAAHVGSAREKPGRTGFAHLFEHLLFLESENLGKGGLDNLSARIGGSGANGSTNRDITNYLQTVPNDALEKMIWAEADKLGFFINTVTDRVLAKEKEVVKNEKRQRFDNQPYGHNFAVLIENLYPQGHPYSWLPIGSLEDLQAATLDDVKEFYKRWYVPNNVTLVIAGDFDKAQAKAWVEKYFNEIPRGQEVKPLAKHPVNLKQTKHLYFEDSFAQLPQLTRVWPSVERYHPDSYAIDILIKLLADGKNAPLNKELIDRQQLTDNVTLFDYRSELAGELLLMVSAFDGVDLDRVHGALQTAFERFETETFSEADLDRIKAGLETDYYNNLASVLGKGAALADHNLVANDPDMINKEINLLRAVTADDIWRVYHQYIKNKHYVSTSFVPKGQKELAVAGAKEAHVTEEKITQNQEATFDAAAEASYEKTPSSFDRSVEPPYGKAPVLPVPNVKKSRMSNGMDVLTMHTDEVPLVEISLNLDGGILFDTKPGTANLVAQLLNRGTANRTPAQLEQAIKQLGAELTFSANKEKLQLKASTLARNYDAIMAIITEMLLEPRWDEKEFSLAKNQVQSQLKKRLSDPRAIADMVLSKLLYPSDHPLANTLLGSKASVASIGLTDVQAYYKQNMAPQLANVQVAGAVEHDQVVASLKELEQKWSKTQTKVPEFSPPELPEKSKLYFYDIPDAKQSRLLIAHPSTKADHPDHYRTQVANYILGGGGFASRLTQTLRESKGYTYGVSSEFSGSPHSGLFSIGSDVRTNVTLESLQLIKEIVEQYGDTFTEQDLATTKSFYLKSNARRFETLSAKLRVLETIADLGLPDDYVQQRAKQVEALTIADVKSLVKRFIHRDKLLYIVVGDAKTQRKRLDALGLGPAVLLN